MNTHQNPNWTVQFQNLPEGWDIDPAIFDKAVEEHIFHCEGDNCSVKGRAVAKGGREGMKFFKIVITKMAMEEDGTPKRDRKTGEVVFDREDIRRTVVCAHHERFLAEVGKALVKNFPTEKAKRGEKVEVFTSTLFQNLTFLAERNRKNKRSEMVAKFFLALTEGAQLDEGVKLDCIQPCSPSTFKDDKRPHNYLVRGGEILGLIPWDDVRLYNGVRHQNKGAFVSANLYLYSESTLEWVEERLVEWRKSADEKSAIKAQRELETAERRRAVEDQRQEAVNSVNNAAAELLQQILGATTSSSDPQTAGGRKGERREGTKPKQRKSAPPSATRQIAEQLEAGEGATPSSDTPDVIVDDSAGGSNPTYAVTLEDRPEVAAQLAAVRVAIDSK